MVTLRKANPDDSLEITRVNVTTWKTAYTGIVPEAMLDERIADLLPRAEKCRCNILEGGRYLVAVDSGTIIAFCYFGACRDGLYPGAGEIYALYVLADQQGRGVGAALFHTALHDLYTEGRTTVLVRCLRGNPALRFYERLGGRVIGQWEQEHAGYRLEGDELIFTR
jgi:GNAT superfamily N-acetyltransferase